MSIGVVSADFVALEAAVVRYCTNVDGSGDADNLAATLERKRALINRMELDFARDASRFAAIQRDVGCDTPYEFLRDECHMTGGAAFNALCVGDLAARIQQSVTALLDNRIGFAHLSVIASTVQAIDLAGTNAGRFDETALLVHAEKLSMVRFRKECAHLRHAADREGFLDEQVLDREWRSLRLNSLPDGGLELFGSFDNEGAALIRTALEPLAERRAGDDDRLRVQRCADALVDLCRLCLDNGAVPQRASQRAHLQVTTSLETLLDLVGAPAGDVEFGGLIAGATVQRLACDATITRILLDTTSAIVDVGRSERVVHGATRRALNVRDKGCRWPGCERTASSTAAHHVVHWAHGGSTDLANLVLLCHRHHWLVHEGGWQLARNEDGSLLTLPPRPVTRLPDPVLIG